LLPPPFPARLAAPVAASRDLAPIQSAETPDALYADRTNLASARRAAAIWAAALAANPKDFESAWKLSRAYYWLGGHTRAAEQRKIYEDGIDAGRKAIAVEPGKPDGHFWMAANMGALAESFGLRAGLKYRGPIKSELETVLRLDAAFNDGSADRALGRWYFKVPHLFGGSHKDAEAHLKASLKYNERSTVTHYFLAELYKDDGRTAAARSECEKVLEAPITEDWGPEDREWKDKARQLLATLR
jgi:tetratricopeptide (TPR) repeat protein